MKIYKCDMCGKYLDIVSLSGICKSDSRHYKYCDFCGPDSKFVFCENCFTNLMHYIYEVRKNHGLEE